MSTFVLSVIHKLAGDTCLQDQIGKPKLRNLGAMPPTKGLQVKQAFTESMYSGGTGGTNPFIQRSPRAMPQQTSFPSQEFHPPQKTAGPPPGEDEGHPIVRKQASLALAALHSIQAIADWEKKAGMATTPAGRLASSMKVGLPKTTAPAGPSIAQIAKPVGFGRPIAGATKSL